MPHLEKIAQVNIDDTIGLPAEVNLQPGLERLLLQLGDKLPCCRQPGFPADHPLRKSLCSLGDDNDTLTAPPTVIVGITRDWLCDGLAVLAPLNLGGHVVVLGPNIGQETSCLLLGFEKGV